MDPLTAQILLYFAAANHHPNSDESLNLPDYSCLLYTPFELDETPRRYIINIMVIRKPIPSGAFGPRRQSDSKSLPYPASPTSSDHPKANFYTNHRQDLGIEAQSSLPQDHSLGSPVHLQHSHSYGSDMSDDWANEDLNTQEPGSQRPIAKNGWPKVIQNQHTEELPSALRVGPPDETPRTSSESQRSRDSHQYVHSQLPRESSPLSSKPTNPYHRGKSSDQNNQGLTASTEESSVDIWAELASGPPPTRSAPLPPVPAPEPEIDNSEGAKGSCLLGFYLLLT